ncbi:hypothetical protein ARMSODRAFT_1021360 [Armillaria solidipes]|uniref:Uncharacterized protein n=1 Tax=Armillaria solidipes TaxID=1076256 RepID=A0A2H3BHQ0_9AGAR|nr:hypothetical protein ARMSODRAFT_1021360 [Armillaria solidipes]
MSTKSNNTSEESMWQNLEVPAEPVSFFLTCRYQVFLLFTDRQMHWLLIVLPDFEREVLDNMVDSWLQGILYPCWFAQWPKNADGMFCQAEEEDDLHEQKVAILQIFTMHLEHKWHMPGGLPGAVGVEAVAKKILGLHMKIDDMVACL